MNLCRSEGFTTDLSRLFTVGKVVLVRIISVDRATAQIVASVKQANATFTKVDEITKLEIGTIVSSGTVSALHESNIVLELSESKVKALLAFATLARHRAITVEVLKAGLEKGATVEDLVVVSKNLEKGFVIVGLVPSKSKNSTTPTTTTTSPSTTTTTTSTSNLTIDSLSPSQIVSGRICGKVPTGLLVQLSKSVRARISKPEICDDYSEIDAPQFALGSNVECVVLSVDKELHRVDLSARRSRLEEGTVVKDPAVGGVEGLVVGEKVRGFVKNVANQGVFVALGAQVTARVLIKVCSGCLMIEWDSLLRCFCFGWLNRNCLMNSSRTGNRNSRLVNWLRERLRRTFLFHFLPFPRVVELIF